MYKPTIGHDNGMRARALSFEGRRFQDNRQTLIRLYREREKMREEIRQLHAAVSIYREVTRRLQAA
jgi:hypothetical protein